MSNFVVETLQLVDATVKPYTITAWSNVSAANATSLRFMLILYVALFGVFVWYMMRNLDFDETEWARATFLFAGVEAVAFAAVGYFFGTQVQRGNVQEAKADAKKSPADQRKAKSRASPAKTTAPTQWLCRNARKQASRSRHRAIRN